MQGEADHVAATAPDTAGRGRAGGVLVNLGLYRRATVLDIPTMCSKIGRMVSSAIRTILVTTRTWVVVGVGLGVGLTVATAGLNGFHSALDVLRLHVALATVYGGVLGVTGIAAGTLTALFARRIRHLGAVAFAAAAATTLFVWAARLFEFDFAYPSRYPFVHGFGGMFATALAAAALGAVAAAMIGFALYRMASASRRISWLRAAGGLGAAAMLSAIAFGVVPSGTQSNPRGSPSTPNGTQSNPRAAATGAPLPVLNGNRVLLVGCDGAEWSVVDRLLDEGELPTLRRLIQGGVRASLRTIPGRPSPSLWTSVASSRVPRETGVTDFYVQKVLGTTTPVAEFPRHFGLNGGLLLQDVLGKRAVRVIPVHAGMVRVRRLWSILADAGVRVGVVNWLVTWPARAEGAAFLVSDRAWSEGRAMRDASIASSAPDAALWDPPAIGAQLPAADDAWRTEDAFSAASALRLYAAYSPQVLIAYFRDVDAAEHLSWDLWEPHFFRGRHGVPPHGGPVRDAYIAFDRYLGELVDAVGPDANVLVVSDHGHHAWFTWLGRGTPGGHTDSPDGVMIASGPAFRRPEHSFAPSLYDVAPTILRLVGRPVAADMRGRVLGEILVDDTPLPQIATYEVGDRLLGSDEGNEMDAAMIERLRALGYVR